MPYGFFMLVRFAALVGFAILAYEASKNKNETGMIVFMALAILFQPFIKIPLGRTVWNVVDVIVAIGLFTSIFVKQKVVEK